MTSTPRKILPTYITNTGNSNIKNYQARAAAQVYSTARNVLPNWTTNYFLPSDSTSTSLSSSTLDANLDTPVPGATTANVGDSVGDRFVAFDELCGKDVFVTATESGFSIYSITDGATEIEELCGYTVDGDVIHLKIIPIDAEGPPKATLLIQKDTQLTLSIVILSTSLIIESSIPCPKNTIHTSIITTSHYISLATPKSLTVYTHTLTHLSTQPLPYPIYTGSNRWLIHPISRISPTTPLTPLLDTPPSPPLLDRMTRTITKQAVSWGRETGEKAVEALTAYLSGHPSPPPLPEKPKPLHIPTPRTTLVLRDVPTNTVLSQFVLPYKVGSCVLSRTGTMLFCSTARGDEFYVYELNQVPGGIHLLSTFSRGYTYSGIREVIWRRDNACFGVLSARGTAHIFSLKRGGRGKDTGRAIGKIKLDNGINTFVFLKRPQHTHRRRSSTRDDTPELLSMGQGRKLASWKLLPATKSTIGLLTAYFNPPTTPSEPQTIPLARQIAEYTLPASHLDIGYSTLSSSPVIKAAFTNQPSRIIDCTSMAEVECSLSTRGITGVRGLRLFSYTLSNSVPCDFGGMLPWTLSEIDLGMPRGEVRYISHTPSTTTSLETPPSSEHESPDLPTESKKKRRPKQKSTMNASQADKGDMERAISASLGTELDKATMITIPPTPPGSIPTPKIPPTEWISPILDRGKSIVRNVRRTSFLSHADDKSGVSFDEGTEVLGYEDISGMEGGFKLDGSEVDSDGSGERKVAGEGSAILGIWEA